ncbi:MAG: TonB-dependent receptor plug domain-containing protein, partial [Bacteroidota bacterium]
MGSIRPVVLLVLLACLQRSMPVYCQSNPPRITLSEKDTPLEKILIAIRKQTGYTYFGDASWPKVAKNITISVKNASIKEVLDLCFKDQPLLRYTLVGNAVAIEVISETAFFVRGKLINDKNEPIIGATITVKGNKSSITTTSDNGEFAIRVTDRDTSLIVTSINYEPKEVRLTGEKELLIQLRERISELIDVVVAHNGYQDIPKDRITGSFTQVSNALINRRVSPNILERLDGVTNSLLFNKNTVAGTNESTIAIRGRSTIAGNPEPLIIIDNFPYNGSINNINPDDVESITVLKDAAAASIWGAFSGNGVIVITTKKGKYNQAPKWSFTTSTTLGEKPDLYYQPILSSSDYIDVEQYLFNHGYYNAANFDPTHSAVSPVVEILLNS